MKKQRVELFLKTVCVLTVLITSFGAYATPQLLDRLVVEGDTIPVYLNTLPEAFYKKGANNVKQGLTANVFGGQEVCVPTSCWDGYLTMWEISDNQLYLTGIYSCCYSEDSIKADLAMLFSGKVVDGKVKADWVSEKKVRGGKGFMLWYDNAMPVFKQEYEFEFSDGQLTGMKTFDNSKTRLSAFHSNEDKLVDYIYSSIEWAKLPRQNETIKVSVRFSANENGTIDDVDILRKSAVESFNQEAVRVIKSIPDWDVFYQKGQHCRQSYYMPITFSEEYRQKFGK